MGNDDQKTLHHPGIGENLFEHLNTAKTHGGCPVGLRCEIAVLVLFFRGSADLVLAVKGAV